MHWSQIRRAAIAAPVIVSLCLSLLACSSSLPASPTDSDPAAGATPLSTQALTPTTPLTLTAPSPSPQPPLALLVAPPDSDAGLAGLLQTVLEDLAAQSGLQFRVASDLAPSDLNESVRLVVALPPDPGLAGLAENAPGTQFLAVSIPGLEPAGNLKVIGLQGDRPDRQGFLAGYLAAVVTPDWRVGIISTQGDPAGMAALRGFMNGAVFYCGLCRPAYPPYHQYPLSVELPAGAGQVEQQAAAEALIAQAVSTVYIYPGAGAESLLEYLAQAEINLIGGAAPPNTVRNRWVASIRSDWESAVREAVSSILSGQELSSAEIPLVVSDANEELFSPGRQKLVEQIRADLSAGFVDAGVDSVPNEP